MTNKEIYFKLSAESDEDILEHFPKRYDDNSLSDLSVPFTNFQKFVVFGKIENMTSIMYGNLIYFDVKPVNSNYRVKLALYNQPFYKFYINYIIFFKNCQTNSKEFKKDDKMLCLETKCSNYLLYG